MFSTRPRVFHTPCFPHPVFSTPRDPIPRDPVPRSPGPRPRVFHLANKSPRVTCENHCRCERTLSLRSQRQTKRKRLVAAAVQTRRLVAATCRRDLSHRVSRPYNAGTHQVEGGLCLINYKPPNLLFNHLKILLTLP